MNPPPINHIPIYIVLYVDKFILFAISPEYEDLFKCLVYEKVKVDFMSNAYLFLGQYKLVAYKDVS